MGADQDIKITYVLLHGTLGHPSDWDSLRPHFSRVETPSLLEFSVESFDSWVGDFERWVVGLNTRVHLVGYSLGARLAIHAASRSPKLFDRVTLVSGHPGLSNPDDRESRLESDRKWSELLGNSDLEKTLLAWDSQPVFCGKTSPFIRKDLHLTRSLWAKTFQTLSLGRQESFSQKLPSALWVAGSEDVKYRDLVGREPRHHVIAGAGHRVPWETQDAFIKLFSTE